MKGLKAGDILLLALAGIALVVPLLVGGVYELDAKTVASLYEGAGALMVGLGAIWAAVRVPASIEHAGHVRADELRTESATKLIAQCLEKVRTYRRVAYILARASDAEESDQKAGEIFHAFMDFRSTLERLQDVSGEQWRARYQHHAECIGGRDGTLIVKARMAATAHRQEDREADRRLAMRAVELLQDCRKLSPSLSRTCASTCTNSPSRRASALSADGGGIEDEPHGP